MNAGPQPEGAGPDLTPDETLVEQAIAGDQAAFGELVRRYQRQAVAVSYRLVGRIEDAADVVQDAFMRAHRNLATLEQRARFGPWLMRIVSNLSLNYRRSRRHTAVPLDDLLEAADDLHRADGAALARDDAPESALLSNELRAQIDRAVRTLPDKQRLALILSSVEGMPQKDVAEILDCSVELVKWNVFQARKKLRDQLRDYL
ncbi:MAG TPA: sigma-70 family RNA polymerase sigma factor [Phycisphaerae bacterium]